MLLLFRRMKQCLERPFWWSMPGLVICYCHHRLQVRVYKLCVWGWCECQAWKGPVEMEQRRLPYLQGPWCIPLINKYSQPRGRHHFSLTAFRTFEEFSLSYSPSSSEVPTMQVLNLLLLFHSSLRLSSLLKIIFSCLSKLASFYGSLNSSISSSPFCYGACHSLRSLWLAYLSVLKLPFGSFLNHIFYFFLLVQSCSH